MDAAVPCLVDFLVFFCLATFGFAVEVAVELAWVLLDAGGFCGAAPPAAACAKTAAAVNIVIRIKRFILSLSPLRVLSITLRFPSCAHSPKCTITPRGERYSPRTAIFTEHFLMKKR